MKKVNKINYLKNNTSNKNGGVLLILILIVIAVISFSMYFYKKTKPVESVLVNYATKESQKSHAYSNMLAGPFATIIIGGEKEEFFYSLDSDVGRLCIVSFKEGESSRYYQQIEAATYENLEDLPESVKLEGASKKMQDELIEIIISNFNTSYGYEFLNETLVKKNFGEYYLAVGESSSNGEDIFLVISIIIISFIIINVAIANDRRRYY